MCVHIIEHNYDTQYSTVSDHLPSYPTDNYNCSEGRGVHNCDTQYSTVSDHLPSHPTDNHNCSEGRGVHNCDTQYSTVSDHLPSLGRINYDARKFLADLGRKISRVSGDDRETTFLFQRISVLFRFNSVSLHDSFELDDRSEH